MVPTSGDRTEFGIPPGLSLRDLAAAVLAALPDADRLSVIRSAALDLGHYVAEESHETLQRRFEEDAARGEGGA